MDAYIFLIESAAVVVPTVATARYTFKGRRRLRECLREPLFWDGGQPVSLATMFSELNGEADVIGALAELLDRKGPLTLSDLEHAVRMLQSGPAACRQLVVDLATEVALRGTIPGGMAATAGVQVVERLADAHQQLGYFAFVQAVNSERPDTLPALLPIEGLMPGGLPLAPPPGDDSPFISTGGGVLGMLSAIGLGRQGDWLPGVVQAVEDLMRERQVKKAREHYHRTLAVLGRSAGESLRRRTPAGDQLRRNVYCPLDAYKNLRTRFDAQKSEPRRLSCVLIPGVKHALWLDFRRSLIRATAVVADKCMALERTLLGKQGQALAGEVLYKHRQSLLVGVSPDAFPLGAVEAAALEYHRLRYPAPETPAKHDLGTP